MGAVTIVFRHQAFEFDFDARTTTSGQLLEQLQPKLGERFPGEQPAAHTLRLLVPKHAAVQLQQQPELLLAAAGVRPGARLLLSGSFESELTALAAAQQAEAALRLPSFEHEAQQAAGRRQRGGSSSPLGRHFFGSFQPLPAHPGAPPSAPPPSAALKLLQTLAADGAIASVMDRHGWRVGLLSEMPPEGKVGVSAVCVLGFNVNKGQEISLRLRTDDMRGFRKYLRIRETLVHELAHMEWSEHDGNFKALNSQLLHEVAQHEAAAAAGRRLLLDGVFDDDDWLGDEQPAAAAAAPRKLGGGEAAAGSAGAGDGLHHLQEARASAAAAALARWQHVQQQEPSQGGPGSEEGGAAAVGGTVAAAVAGDVDMTDGFDGDPATAAAEQQLRRLGSLADEDVGPQQLQQEEQLAQHPDKQQRQQELAQVQQMAEDDHHQQQQQQELAQVQQMAQDDHHQQQQQQQQQPSLPPSLWQPADQQHTPVAADVAASDAAAAAAAVMEAAGADVAVAKLARAKALLQRLVWEAGQGAAAGAVEAVAGVLSNLAAAMHEQRWRRLRLGNAAFQRRLGRFPAAVQLLQLAGFAERQMVWQQREGYEPAGEREPVLLYVRNDPGLLWLVLSAVRDEAACLVPGSSDNRPQQPCSVLASAATD